MPRKTNYSFERLEREKARAKKKADRQRLKQERSERRKQDFPDAAENTTSEDANGDD